MQTVQPVNSSPLFFLFCELFLFMVLVVSSRFLRHTLLTLKGPGADLSRHCVFRIQPRAWHTITAQSVNPFDEQLLNTYCVRA